MGQDSPFHCMERPLAESAALVVDSPHSGGGLPDDLEWQGDTRLLLMNEDVGVDRLFADVPQQGGALLTAAISRHYIDLNRAPDDLDPQLVTGARSGRDAHAHGGLIRRLPGRIVPLSIAAVERRLSDVWWPYHRCLARLLEVRRQHFGAVWHLNAHSMPAGTRDGRGRLVDIVLGNRHGITASADFMQVLAVLCEKEGLRVAHNDPYAGVECVRRYGNPAGGIHSVQIEIGRHLFYDEQRFRFLPQMEKFRASLNRIVSGVADYTCNAARPSGRLAAE